MMHQDGSSMMFPLGLQGVLGLATSDPLTQMTQLALILLQLPSRQLTCASTPDKWPRKWLDPWVSLLILQQPIRAMLLWWLLNLSFKIVRPPCSCFLAAMTLFSYLFNPVCKFFPFSFFLFFFFFFFQNLPKKIFFNSVHKYKIEIKTNRLRYKIEIYVS